MTSYSTYNISYTLGRAYEQRLFIDGKQVFSYTKFLICLQQPHSADYCLC